MGMGRALAVALVGLNGHVVEVEADIGQTLQQRQTRLLRMLLVVRFAARLTDFRCARFGNAVADEADGIEAGHVLLLQEENGMAFAFGE